MTWTSIVVDMCQVLNIFIGAAYVWLYFYCCKEKFWQLAMGLVYGGAGVGFTVLNMIEWGWIY